MFDQKGRASMPTQEERLSTLEQTVTGLGKGIRDLNHHATILLGVTSEQGKDIREMKVSLAALSEHLDAFEQSVNYRFETLEQDVNGRFEEQGKKLDQVLLLFETLEQDVNGRFEEQGKKLDQVLLLLNKFAPKAE